MIRRLARQVNTPEGIRGIGGGVCLAAVRAAAELCPNPAPLGGEWRRSAAVAGASVVCRRVRAGGRARCCLAALRAAAELRPNPAPLGGERRRSALSPGSASAPGPSSLLSGGAPRPGRASPAPRSARRAGGRDSRRRGGRGADVAVEFGPVARSRARPPAARRSRNCRCYPSRRPQDLVAWPPFMPGSRGWHRHSSGPRRRSLPTPAHPSGRKPYASGCSAATTRPIAACDGLPPRAAGWCARFVSELQNCHWRGGRASWPTPGTPCTGVQNRATAGRKRDWYRVCPTAGLRAGRHTLVGRVEKGRARRCCSSEAKPSSASTSAPVR
jgi:hypothetical protein